MAHPHQTRARRGAAPVVISKDQHESIAIAILSGSPQRAAEAITEPLEPVKLFVIAGVVRFSEVGADSVGVGEGELRAGLFPVSDDLTLDEASFGFSFGRARCCVPWLGRALACPQCCRSQARAA